MSTCVAQNCLRNGRSFLLCDKFTFKDANTFDDFAHFFHETFPGPFFLYFRLLNIVSSKYVHYKICWWLDSNWRPLGLEATALPIELRPHRNNISQLESRHSSVDLSAPTILPPQFQVPSTPSMLFTFIVMFVLFLSRGKDKRNKKRPGLAHFKNTSFD